MTEIIKGNVRAIKAKIITLVNISNNVSSMGYVTAGFRSGSIHKVKWDPI